MALHILSVNAAQVAGSGNTAGFTAIQMSATSPPAIADIASINQGIVDDQSIISTSLGVPSAAVIQGGIIFTGSISGAAATTITSFSATSPAGATIGQINAGMTVTGPGLSPGTKVISATGTTITLDRGAVAAATTQTYVVARAFQGGLSMNVLTIPNRGTLKLLPGDVVALDVYGFPYVIPATSLGANAPFTFT